MAHTQGDEDDGYDRFVEAYPRPCGDPVRNYRAYMEALEDGATIDQMLSALEWQRNQPSWTERGGQFIPSPEKWLKNRGWTREKPKDQALAEKKSLTFHDVAEGMKNDI